jgi:hypothetical protein
MAKNRSGHRPGGGIASRQRVEKPIRQGAARERVIPAGAAQLGQRQGNHITERGSTGYGGVNLLAGTGYPSELGNKVALNVGKGGPGTGRKIYSCGSQGVQGEVDRGQSTPRRDILSEFGPDSKR